MSTPRFLITGPPGCGKTTLIKRIARSLNRPARGFFTEEIRERGKRAGFGIASFSGTKGILSHIDFRSPHKVGKYGVDLQAFEQIAVPEIVEALANRSLLLVDEIGKMELFSSRFKELIERVFQSEIPFVSTILFKSHPFCDKLKKAEGVKLLFLSKSNNADIFEEIRKELS